MKKVSDKHLAQVPGVGALRVQELVDAGTLKLTVKDNDGNRVDVTDMTKDEIRAIAEEQLKGQPELVVKDVEITNSGRGEARVLIYRKTGVQIMKEAVDDD